MIVFITLLIIIQLIISTECLWAFIEGADGISCLSYAIFWPLHLIKYIVYAFLLVFGITFK
jgi:hypothetical protein